VSPVNRRRRNNKKRKPKKPAPRRGPREPNELELLVARGVSRLLDLGDAALLVVEKNPDRAVNAVIGAIEGVGKIGEFVRSNPDEAKRIATGLAVEGVNKLSNAVISAGARQLRKNLNGKREKKRGQADES